MIFITFAKGFWCFVETRYKPVHAIDFALVFKAKNDEIHILSEMSNSAFEFMMFWDEEVRLDQCKRRNAENVAHTNAFWPMHGPE